LLFLLDNIQINNDEIGHPFSFDRKCFGLRPRFTGKEWYF